MIENRVIVCFASGYDAPPTSKHHVAHILAEHNVVLWVNYHASRTPSATADDARYILKKLSQVFGGIKEMRKNLFVLTPLVLPFPASKAAKKINRILLGWQIRRAVHQIAAGRPLHVWSFAPDVAYCIDSLHPEKVIYYCVDDFAHFTGYDPNQVRRDEQALCRRSDLVVATSQNLYDDRIKDNPNTLLVPHGVDYSHFAAAANDDAPLPLPHDVAEIPQPRIGFFGLLRDWVDIKMLAIIASRRTEWQFVLIGDANMNIDEYRKFHNMHFLGRKSYKELPAYCRAFDVGIIPFQMNELTAAANPIKLREYLAAGLPVVSSPMPEVRRYAEKGLVRLASGADEFERAIDAAIKDSPAMRQKYSRAMIDETWPAKIELICEHLMKGGK
ncbi:MAG TPA: glycosyltransferase [Phycisphaerae bacterium]|nr:glycosyltransferase [Phycisphaerae bacterium]HPS52563.1 glycosyltransferase [Phycisphaerae bacterium]